VETKKELKGLMFQFSRFLRGNGGFCLPFLFLVLVLLFILIGCSTPMVEVGKVTVVIQEPIKSPYKGEV
jgi:hypothetical protein